MNTEVTKSVEFQWEGTTFGSCFDKEKECLEVSGTDSGAFFAALDRARDAMEALQHQTGKEDGEVSFDIKIWPGANAIVVEMAYYEELEEA